MNIATMVRGYVPVPRPADLIYAPIDLAVDLSQGLVAHGHQVVFYAPTGSHVGGGVVTESAKLPPLARNLAEYQELIHSIGRMVHGQSELWDLHLARNMFERAAAGQYDLLHFHHAESAWPLAALYPQVPVVYTLHDPIEPWFIDTAKLHQTPSQSFVSISDNQRRDAPHLPYAATVYNGIDTSAYAYVDRPGEYLLFAGRIVPDKGVKEAVEVARQTGERLLIAGPTFPDHQAYFDDYVKPYLDDRIQYLGALPKEAVIKHYQHAKALLCPIQWEEPFGLTMVEAMACGTPVIAFGRGSVREVLADGQTGFAVQTVNEMVAAVGRLNEIERRACRHRVEQHFSIQAMVEGYERVFQRLTGS